VATAIVVVGCGPLVLGCGDERAATGEAGTQPAVMADTTFLADITRNVAGERLSVASLLPLGADPHSFEPTPRDARKIADSRVVVINNYGLEPQVDELIASAGSPDLLVVEAAAGLPARTPQPGEAVFAGDHGVDIGDEAAEVDPHFWLDPIDVVAYVDNIRRGLSSIDPEGADAYEAQADLYAEQLRKLDGWIKAEVEKIPAGAEGSPSAQDMAALVEEIRATGAPAIFVESGSSSDLAAQIAGEAGVELVTDLYTHSLGENLPTYLDMMRWNVSRIVEALQVDSR
jgi:ABC-type Zn uptake system ZnuABC Zn-binding protein ZnuA